ncbi:MAG: hypothetical protein LAO76_21150 [Acidobacteriia bacterium]|nr:hypothetical protein [Terriglobia bacterium]
MNLLARIMNDDNLPQLASRRNARSETNSELPSAANTDSDVPNSQQERTDSSVQDAQNTDESDNRSPSVVAVIAQRQMPSRLQIEAAIMANSKARAKQLIAGETLDVARPFSVFSRLEVEKIKVKHERGLVVLEIDETMCQEDGRILPQRTVKRELSIVRSSDGVWVISDTQERTYVMEEQALGIFEHQAELLLRRAPNSSNTRIMVKALDHLYDEQTGEPQRAAIR